MKKKENKKLQQEIWVRLAVLIISIILFQVIAVILLIIIIINLIIAIIKGKPDSGVVEFSKVGFNEIMRLLKYLLFISNERPFPFNELKKGE